MSFHDSDGRKAIFLDLLLQLLLSFPDYHNVTMHLFNFQRKARPSCPLPCGCAAQVERAHLEALIDNAIRVLGLECAKSAEGVPPDDLQVKE